MYVNLFIDLSAWCLVADKTTIECLYSALSAATVCTLHQQPIILFHRSSPCCSLSSVSLFFLWRWGKVSDMLQLLFGFCFKLWPMNLCLLSEPFIITLYLKYFQCQSPVKQVYCLLS